MSYGIQWCVIVSVMRRCWNDSVRHTRGRRPTVWTTDRLNDCRPTRRVRSVGSGGGDGGDWERPPRSHTPFFSLSFRSVPFRFFRARISYPSPLLFPPTPGRPAPVGHGRARSRAAGVRAPSMTVAIAAEEKSVGPGGAVRHYYNFAKICF